MSNQKLHSLFTLRNNSVVVNDKNWWLTLKKVFRKIKFILYFFSFLMIVWSFIQSFAQPYTNYSSSPGAGLEFGFMPTGNSSNNSGDDKYHTFSMVVDPITYHSFYMPTVKYGPFLSICVYPFASLFLNLIYAIGKASSFLENSGLHAIFSIILFLFFIRLLTFFITLRGAYYGDKQYHFRNQIEKINRKYSGRFDKSASFEKQKEINKYNTENGLKPFAQIENFFILTPLFLITFRVITIMRPLKFVNLFGILKLSKTPISMIFYNFVSGGWCYLLLCLLIIPINYISQKIPVWLSQKRNEHMKNPLDNIELLGGGMNSKKIQIIISIVFLCFIFFSTTGLAIYYLFNSIFTIAQSYLIHWILLKIEHKDNNFSNKLKKFNI